MFRVTIFLMFACILQIVSGHFELKYPPSRGYDEDRESTFPCGGFDTVKNRTEMPLKNGFLQIDSGHTVYSYIVNVLAKNNPTPTDFYTSLLTVAASGVRGYPQDACITLDLGDNTNIDNGTNATIQIQFNGGDGLLYQCTDVTFVDSAPDFNNSMCINADGSATSVSGSAPADNATHSKASSLAVSTGLLLISIAYICTMV